ncbi:MAG: hypothetical protein U0528_12590 [Anaerolineae bacterium]
MPPTATDTATATATATLTPTLTSTNTEVPPTATDTPTNTPVPPTATDTATATATLTSTNTEVPPTATETPTNTPVPPTATYTATATATLTPTLTSTNTAVPPTATSSSTATRTNTPVPTLVFYRGINLGGPALVIDGNNWDANSGTTTNLTTNGSVLCNPWVPVTPSTDSTRATMISCSRQHWAHNLVMSSVPNGQYQVSLYVWQDWADPNPGAFTVAIEGATVLASYTPGVAGRWDKLGPFNVTISDGTINIATSGGIANISGLEVWSGSGGSSATATNTSLPATATMTRTSTATNTAVPPTATRTNTATNTVVPSATSTNTPGPSLTPSNTFTPSATLTPSATFTPSFTSTATNTPLPPTATFTATATNTPLPPTATSTRTNTATNTPVPTLVFYRGINLGGPALVVDGNNWEANSGTTTNLTANGSVICNPWVPVTPSTDSNRATMISCSRQHWAHNIVMSSVPNGQYQVSLYVWQDWADPNPGAFTVAIEGATVLASYTPGVAGRWDKLGPFNVTISDGTINITTSGGIANISGLEVWRGN